MLAVVTIAGLFLLITVFPSGIQKDAPIRQSLVPTEDGASYTNINGDEVSLEDDFGKVVVVYSWASWCPQCSSDLQTVNDFAEGQVGDRISFIAVNRAENRTTAQRFLATLPELNNLQIVLDPTDHLFNSVTGYAMPETVIFNREGDELYHGRGVFDLKAVEEVIRRETEN